MYNVHTILLRAWRLSSHHSDISLVSEPTESDPFDSISSLRRNVLDVLKYKIKEDSVTIEMSPSFLQFFRPSQPHFQQQLKQAHCRLALGLNVFVMIIIFTRTFYRAGCHLHILTPKFSAKEKRAISAVYLPIRLM